LCSIKKIDFFGKPVTHGLRSIVSTAFNEEGFNADVIEAALAHVDKNVIRGVYSRSNYLPQRQALLA